MSDTQESSLLDGVLGLTLMTVVMLLCGPALFRGAISRFGGIRWRQLLFALAGTALWIVILSAVINRV